MDYVQIYADFLKQHISLSNPLKIVCDSSNGPAGMIIAKLRDIPHLQIISINDAPNPDFPAHGPNPLKDNAHEQAAKKIQETQADFGVIFDADGDRAFFVDDMGVMLPSFLTSILLFKNNKPPFIADELVYKSLEHMSVISLSDIIPSKVGSRFVKEKLKEHGASTGAEFSGHYYFKDFFGVDSGIFALIQVINTLSALGTKLSEFVTSLPKHDMLAEEVNLGPKKWSDIEPIIKEYAQKNNFKIETREGVTLDNGELWINIRTSNTEPILRFIGGSSNTKKLSETIEELKALV